jgi:hypothetical protein
MDKLSEILVHEVLVEKYQGKRPLLTHKGTWEDAITEIIQKDDVKESAGLNKLRTQYNA